MHTGVTRRMHPDARHTHIHTHIYLYIHRMGWTCQFSLALFGIPGAPLLWFLYGAEALPMWCSAAAHTVVLLALEPWVCMHMCVHVHEHMHILYGAEVLPMWCSAAAHTVVFLALEPWIRMHMCVHVYIHKCVYICV